MQLNVLLQQASRRAFRDRRFSLLVVSIFAFGIGAATTVFGLADAILLRPLPFKDPERLVRLWETNPGRNISRFSVSAENFNDWRERLTSLESLTAVSVGNLNMSGDGRPERLRAVAATASLFGLLGVEPALGRGFLEAEDSPSGPRAVILSHGFWQRRFQADPSTVGRALRLNGEVFSVVGVMPEDYSFPYAPELWTPLRIELNPGNRDNKNYDVMARLAPGASLAQAQQELLAVAAELESEYPAKNAGWAARIETFDEWLVPSSARTALLLLMSAVGLVVLAACSNVAGLMLARGAARGREQAIRAALGAARRRLIGEALTESLLLALCGAGLGALLSVWAIDALQTLAPNALPLIDLARVDWRVLGFAAALAVATALAAGLVPALRTGGGALGEQLKEGARGATASPASSRLRAALLVGQLALAAALLVAAGLSLRSLARLADAPLGFEPRNVLTAATALPGGRYPDGGRWRAFYRQLVETLRNSPGVEAAAISSGPPLTTGGTTSINFGTVEPSTLAPEETLQMDWRVVSPGYFEAIGIPLRAGRDIGEADEARGLAPVLISRSAAEQLWPGADAIGKHLTLQGERRFEIIGVTGDVRARALDQEGRPTGYIPYFFWQWSSAVVIVRTTGDPTAATELVRRTVAALDPELPVFSIQTMQSLVEQAAAQARLTTTLLGAFAASAALLAALGLYGLLAYSVARRTSEIGVRMALGAERAGILAMVLGRSARMLAAGLAIGMPLSLLLARAMQSSLYEVVSYDPPTYAAVAGLLAAVVAAASWIPARRASRIDPLTALRYE